MSDIVLKEITKRFEEKTVISDRDFVFPGGKISSVMGPSGAGKTTLLMLIAGLSAPDTGEITGVPERLSFVFQEDRLCEDFNAVANVRLVTGKRIPDEEIREELLRLGIPEESLSQPVREFSGGMKRRVSIARAILYDPELILLDEPFKGLDEDLRRNVMDELLEKLHGKTVILVTHDPEEAEYMGGKIISL
ncbi:MAG: ATP-binding cassette domain-containing protein [Lachnospiraceae bacterium]|nr:ATP-binding cassette domain-containing protein [Lachnospiraceae bacterium]